MLNETAEGRVAPARNKVMYVFYDFETTQNNEYTAWLSYEYIISPACNRSVRGAKTRMTRTACDVERGNTRSGKIMRWTCFHKYPNHASGPIRS